MLVLAAPGVLVPVEGKPRDYISDVPPEGEAGYSVPESAYYLRRLSDRDLVIVPVPPVPVSPAADASAPATKTKGGA